MFSVSAGAARLRILVTRLLAPIGFRDDSFLIVLAVVVGVLASIMAVTFHELIIVLRDLCFKTIEPGLLYGPGVVLLIAFPAIGGFVVALLNLVLRRGPGGHGIPDVIESIARGSGWMRPLVAIEKTLTAAVTIGTGGSTGAEGPIVQIGSAVASGVGQLFRLARSQMPLIIGCGAAAGISAIFNAPMGGVLFVLEVILLDFSLKTFAPVMVASVIANVTTQAIFRNYLNAHENYTSIFFVPTALTEKFSVTWPQLFNFVLLGILCGMAAVALTIVVRRLEALFHNARTPSLIKPAIGGAAVGAIGVIYVMIFYWLAPEHGTPEIFKSNPLPAFFSDGYTFVQLLLDKPIYTTLGRGYLISLLAFVLIAKIFATGLTLGSGGSGGVIAPALFIGAALGGLMGVLLNAMGFPVTPGIYALVGMGATLAAMIHAPLASILILFEVVRSYHVVLPSMLSSVIAVGIARRMIGDSIYTFALKEKGIQTGQRGASLALRQLYAEQVTLDPAAVVQPGDGLQQVLELAGRMHVDNFVVIDRQGHYIGMLLQEDVSIALHERDAAPLLVVSELMRHDVPFVRNSDNLGAVMELMNQKDLDVLPVCLEQTPGKVIGLLTRAGVMRTYQARLAG